MLLRHESLLISRLLSIELPRHHKPVLSLRSMSTMSAIHRAALGYQNVRKQSLKSLPYCSVRVKTSVAATADLRGRSVDHDFEKHEKDSIAFQDYLRSGPKPSTYLQGGGPLKSRQGLRMEEPQQ